MDLETDTAYRLVTGRAKSADKSAIIGLLGFADRLRIVWRAAIAGDPYARWWLIKVERACINAHTEIHDAHVSTNDSLALHEALGMDHVSSKDFRRVDLAFACPYAYWGARLVRQSDRLIADLHTAVQIGVLPKADAASTQRDCLRAVRRAFTAAQGFHNFSLTRDSLDRRDATAVDAEATMGALPESVLSGRRWPLLVPRVRSQKEAVLKQ